MTDLTTPITRRTRLVLDNRINPRDRDLVAVTLYPNATIGFRQYKCRREIRLDLATVYRLACLEEGRRHEGERRKRRLVKRGCL